MSTEPAQEELGLRNVANLGFVSLFTDISTEMILGVLPFFVINELGATKALLGLMEGAAESLNYLFRTFSGVLTDRIGRRKPLVLIGYGLSTFAKPFFSLARSFSDALAVRLTDRAGKGIRTSPRDALISDSVKEARSGRAFGLHRSLDQVGAIVGPVLSFLLIPFLGTRGLFLASLIPGIVALGILVFFVRDRKSQRQNKRIFENARQVLNRTFTGYLVVVGIFALGAYNFSFVLVKAGALGVDAQTIPLVYATLNVATVVVGLPSGLLADKYGKMPILMTSFGLFALTSLGGSLATSGVQLAFSLAFLYGLYLGMSETVQRAFIPSLIPAESKGTGYAFYYLILSVGSFTANLVFGILWDQVSPGAAFTYSIGTSITAILALGLLVPLWKGRKPEKAY